MGNCRGEVELWMEYTNGQFELFTEEDEGNIYKEAMLHYIMLEKEDEIVLRIALIYFIEDDLDMSAGEVKRLFTA